MGFVKVFPSIIACDLAHLADEAERIEKAGADAIHVDIMDGHFVPNITFGPDMVASLNRSTKLPLDVHLMMYNPYDYIERFIAAGADSLTIHFEATEDVEDTLKFIRHCGIRAGLSFSPETSMTMIPKYLPMCDFILLMTVNPGFSGQKFMPEVLEKIRFTRMISNRLGLGIKGEKKKDTIPFDIQVDGGITEETARQCAEAGANIFISGSFLFNSPSMGDSIHSIRTTCEKNFKSDVSF